MSPELNALVEKVAREIYKTFPASDSDPWDAAEARYAMYELPGRPHLISAAITQARASIRAVAEATREPSEAMGEAYWKAAGETNAWRAMHAASTLGEALRDE